MGRSYDTVTMPRHDLTRLRLARTCCRTAAWASPQRRLRSTRLMSSDPPAARWDLDRPGQGPPTCAMPTAPSNGIEIWYETFGDPDDVPLLLIMGLGSQAIQW